MCDAERYMRIGECWTCDGAGEVCTGSTSGSWDEPPEPIIEPCPDCNGTGRGEWEETEPVTLSDTTGVLAPVECFYKYPDFWPFEPAPETECRPCPVREFPRQLDDWFASIFTSHPKLPRFQ